jgi:DNA excision repair protein ERCC-3
MRPKVENALIVQSDSSILLDTHALRASEARAALAPFAELVKSPEHVHTYRLTPLSIWNACASGFTAAQMVVALREHARYPVPANVEAEVLELAARYGRVVITRDGDWLRCTCSDVATAESLSRDRKAGAFLAMRLDGVSFRLEPGQRGVLKQALIAARIFSRWSRATTREEEFAHYRKLFLTEQGYSYQIVVAGGRE